MPIAVGGRRGGTDTTWSGYPVTFWFKTANSIGNQVGGPYNGGIKDVSGGPWNKMRVSPFTQFGAWVKSGNYGIDAGGEVEYFNGKVGSYFPAATGGENFALEDSNANGSALPATDYLYCAAFIPREFSSGSTSYDLLPNVVGSLFLDEGFGLGYGERSVANGTCNVKAYHLVPSGTDVGPKNTIIPFVPNVVAVCYQNGIMSIATNTKPAVSQAVAAMNNSSGKFRIGVAADSSVSTMGGVIFEVVFMTGIGPEALDEIIKEMCREYGIAFTGRV